MKANGSMEKSLEMEPLNMLMDLLMLENSRTLISMVRAYLQHFQELHIMVNGCMESKLENQILHIKIKAYSLVAF